VSASNFFDRQNGWRSQVARTKEATRNPFSVYEPRMGTGIGSQPVGYNHYSRNDFNQITKVCVGIK